MDSVQWEKINNDQFNVFIRDLSQSVNANLKHMIEDLDKETSTKNSKQKKKKIKHIKKKDLIIQQQNAIRSQKLLEDDQMKMKFLLDSINNDDPYSSFTKLKTKEGKTELKLKLLDKYWTERKEYLHHALNLYFHLKYSYQGKHDLLTKIDTVIENYDVKSYMFKELGHLLPPLNFWDQGIHTFDDWQKDTIHKIKCKSSVLVKAPTSSGKTFIAMAAGIIHSKIIYICPAKPIVYQVGSHFVQMGYKVHYLIDNHSHMSYNSKTNIFIGTPECVETNLPKIGCDFDYAVFDEIHNLNEYSMGICYENIIKLLPCNFLALSATIENINTLRNIFQNYHPSQTIDLIEYHQRFINQQRWIYNQNKLQKVHPCCCLSIDAFEDFKNISFTPNDCYVLYEKMCEIFDDNEELEDRMDDLSPDEYFKEDRLLTLNDAKQYEILLKNELQNLSLQYPQTINQMLSEFQMETTSSNCNHLDDIIELFQECKQNDLLPMLYFHTEEDKAKEIFMKLDTLLYKSEKKSYPFHYVILEKKKELYDEYILQREIYDSKIKIKSKNAFIEKQDKMIEYDKKEKQKYILEMIQFYNTCLKKCNESQSLNLEKELQSFIHAPDFNQIDQFKKYKDFCFTNHSPMSANDIRNIRREIRESTGLNIHYESPIFQLLKRGIGLYIQSMPDKYNWILQKLMSERKLGIVISDRTLCLGIDLPIRTVALSGYQNPNYTTSDYLQMSGRAGRRGHDNQGNIIFHNVSNAVELMKGKLPELIGSSKPMYQSHMVLKELNPKLNIHNLFTERIMKDTKVILDESIQSKNPRLLWCLRYYENSHSFVQSLKKIEKLLFREIETDRELFLLNYLNDNLFHYDPSLIKMYKQNKVTQFQNYQCILNLGNVCKHICNTLHKKTFMITIQSSMTIFQKCKDLLYKYHELA